MMPIGALFRGAAARRRSGVFFRRLSGANLAAAEHHVLLRGEALEAHRAARMQLVGRNADLRAQAVFEAIAKRVEAFTSTELESTSRRKRRALASSSVTIASVCCEPYLPMCSIAALRSLTTRTARMGARYSAYQSSSMAGFMLETSARDFSSPRSSTPLSA